MPRGVFIRTQKNLAKLRAFTKSRIGVPRPQWVRDKISIAHKGKSRGKMSEEHKRKIGLGNKGKTLSQEARKKLSLWRTGRPSPLKGKKQDPDFIERRTAKLARGEKHYKWKGGSKRAFRASREYRKWRTAVFERDNYTCVWCGIRSGCGKTVVLNADHIIPYAINQELRLDLSNGRTLCEPCHRKTDTYGFRTLNKIKKCKDIKII